ncbi:MAG: FGGY-family carbohydrate kinase, partial [Cyclobacteriaceae bacterium]
GLRGRLFDDTYTSDEPAGTLSPEWAKRLGLNEDVVVGVGAFDAHMGAVGGEIIPYYLSKVMGTSTCDMLIAPNAEMGNKLISGICGQVDGSIVPGMLGMEAGQSAFGDIYAWFSKLIAWPLQEIVAQSESLDESTKQALIKESIEKIIPLLSGKAAKIPVDETGMVALDWLNGRRTPDANQSLKGAITGLSLGSNAPRIFKSLVEATCFGAKKIVERFEEEGVKIEGIIGLGGVAKKSPFIMQTMADVLNRPIKIAKSEQTCALGAAMFAATAAGLYQNVAEAKDNMGGGFDTTYEPRQENITKYQQLYHRFAALGRFVEDQL